ncbi:MAG: ribosome silencing factor [Chitinivibrionales bacterium]|nr:ribosome silencing factor [Chitinivibrionales bacterium]
MNLTASQRAGKALARLIAEAALDKKAEDVVTLALDPQSGIADWFVICQSDNSAHIRAIADGIIETLKARGFSAWHVEGREDAAWIVLDYVDVVVHIMLAELRAHYQLEDLWKEYAAPKAGKK